MEATCFSCSGKGHGTWCAYCQPTPPALDAYGLPIPDGRIGGWIQTYTGGQMWPLSPRAEDITIEDIAIGLSREFRYGKQTLRPYTVAEHSVIVSLIVEQMYGRELAPEALLHDCDEGYLPDMPRPLKYEPSMSMDAFRSCGENIRAAAYARFGVNATEESHAAINIVDKRLVVDEIAQLVRRPELHAERLGGKVGFGVIIDGLSSDDALTLFLSRFADLFPEHLT